VRPSGSTTSEFPVTIKLHQGSTLTSYLSYLFALVMDEFTTLIQDKVPCCMFFFYKCYCFSGWY